MSDPYLQSTYRVIYIPIYFWLVWGIYLLGLWHISLKRDITLSAYIKKGIGAGFFLHLYILLGALVSYLSKNITPLPNMYFCYIKAAFLLFTIVLSYAASEKARQGKVSSSIVIPLFAAIVYAAIVALLDSRTAFAASLAASAAAGGVLGLSNLGTALKGIRQFFRKDLNMVIAIFLLAFVIRAVFGVILVNKTIHTPRGYDGYLYASDDALTYDEVASMVAKDPSCVIRGEIKIWGNWDVMFGVLVGFIYKVFGRNFYIVVLFQALFGSLIPPCAFLIGKELFSRVAGIISAVLLSFKGGSILLSTYMGHEALWLPLLLIFFVLHSIYFKRPDDSGGLRDVMMGIILGAVMLLRSMYIMFLPFLWLWEILFFRRVPLLRRLVHLCVVTIVAFSLTAGIFYFFKNEFKATPKDKMEYLYTSLLCKPFFNIGNERLLAEGIDFIHDPKGAIAVIREHPFKFARLAAEIYPLRVIAYFEIYQFGFFDPTYMVNPAKIPNRFASTLEFYFTLFFLAGLFVCIKRRDLLASGVFMILVYHVTLLAIILIRQSPRLKEISSPFVYLIGGYGFYLIARFLSGDGRKGEERYE
jgi:4-amino-4-deoxy-L-arabinose transferase-like glycosyltransferase